MELIQAVTKEQLGRVEALYLSAFPKGERKPFEIILQKREEGFSTILQWRNRPENMDMVRRL